MAMNTNDSNENSSITHDPVSESGNTSPVLSPETVKQPSDQAAPIEETPPQQTKEKKSHAKAAVIISALSVLLVGAIVVAGLALSGAFAKDEKSEKKKTSKREATNKEKDDEEKDDEEKDDDETDQTAPPHEIVTSLYGITDELFTIINDHAEEYFNNWVSCNFPAGVTVTNFNFIGITMTDDSWSGFPDTEHSINTIYQVIVEDTTGREPIERQFFWFLGIHGIYQDGTLVNTSAHSVPGRDVCFDTWCTQGYQSFETIYESHIVKEAMEEDIDKCLILPINGQPYSSPDNTGIESLSEITIGQYKAMDDHSRDIYDRLYSVSGVEYLSMEPVGEILTFDNQNQYRVVMAVYEIQAQKGDETCTFYWYRGFEDLCRGGEMKVECGISPSSTPVEINGIEVCGLPDIDAVKENIRNYSGYEILECNIEGYEQSLT
ncbi:MAG: hypothetical protein J5636_07430 [Clostridiales bacterium]|nr:hypothetical protein [Clostridiales bacterium]